jgi:hypothetical protein
VYLPHEAGDRMEIDLPNAATTADVHRASRELSDDAVRLSDLLKEASPR